MNNPQLSFPMREEPFDSLQYSFPAMHGMTIPRILLNCTGHIHT
jgi:hypothetical protein